MDKLLLSILRSQVEYPQDIREFFRGIASELFPKEYNDLITAILNLSEQHTLNITTLESNLSDNVKNSDMYIEFLNAPINPNYLHLKPLLIQELQLKEQHELAHKLLNAGAKGEVLDLDTLKKNVVSEEKRTLKQWQEYYATRPNLPKFKTHISFIDSFLNNGIEGGQLILISGDPEAGKTMLGTQILENIAKTHKVAFFCFEFTINSYIKAKSSHNLNRDNIIVIDDNYNINDIARNIKELYTQNVCVFLIDSQMRIVSPQGRNMEEEESLKFSTLARLAHSLNIVILLIVQTSKGDRDNPMGSKKGGHEASIIMRLEHCKAKDENLREFSEQERIFIVKKNKQTGKHFKEKVLFNPQTLYFSAYESPKDENATKIDLAELQKLIQDY